MHSYDYETLADRVVLVTGGGSGLGAAICTLLAEEGAKVAIADIRVEAAQGVADQIARAGGRAQACRLDVTDEASIQAALADVTKLFGRLDALVNNAGVDVTAGIREISAADWQRVIATNLTGPFLLSKHGLEFLNSGGHIVNIASTAARRAWPNASAYHASARRGPDMPRAQAASLMPVWSAGPDRTRGTTRVSAARSLPVLRRGVCAVAMSARRARRHMP